MTGPGATRGGFSNKQRELCGGTRRAPISSPGRGPPPLLRHRPSPCPPAGGARRTASLSSSSSCRPRLCTHLATGVGAHIRGKTTSSDRRGDGWEGSREELVEPVSERSADRWSRRRFSQSVWDRTLLRNSHCAPADGPGSRASASDEAPTLGDKSGQRQSYLAAGGHRRWGGLGIPG